MKKKERKPCGEEARGLSKFALIPNMPLQRITSSYVAMLECSAKCTTQREREREFLNGESKVHKPHMEVSWVDILTVRGQLSLGTFLKASSAV